MTAGQWLTALSGLLFAAMFARLGGVGAGWLPAAPVWGALALAAMALSRVADRGLPRVAGGPAGWRALAVRHAFVLALAAVTVLALAVRLPGISTDLGHHPPNIDEHRLAANVKQFLATGAVGYHTVEHYPGILFWILAAASLVLYLRGLMEGAFATIRGMPVETFILAGRVVSAALGAGTVALVGLIGRQVSGVPAGIVAAALVALAPLAMQTAMTNRNDPMQVLLICATVHASLAAGGSDRRRWPVLAGVYGGLATAVKYTSAFALAPALAASMARGSVRERAARSACAMAAFGLATAVTNHFLWWDVANFVRQLSDQVGITGPGHWGAMDNPAAFHAEILARFGIGWPLLVLAAAFGAYTLARGDRRALIFWLLPVLYSWFTTKRPSQFPRWVYPLLPFAAVAGAAALAWLAGTLRARSVGAGQARWRTALAGVLVAVAVGPPVWRGVSDLSRRLNPPTHILLEQWLAQRPAGEIVLLERGWLQLPAGSIAVRRVPDLARALDGSLYALAAADWVVVPEPLFRHPGLKRLGLARRFAADQHRFGGNVGYDFEVYSTPMVPPVPTPLEIRFESPDAAALLGDEWPSPVAGRPGRELPAAGASVFLPLAATTDVDFIVELEATGPSAAEPVTIADTAGAIALSARPGGHAVTLAGSARASVRGRPIELRILPQTRRTRVRVLRLVAGEAR